MIASGRREGLWVHGKSVASGRGNDPSAFSPQDSLGKCLHCRPRRLRLARQWAGSAMTAFRTIGRLFAASETASITPRTKFVDIRQCLCGRTAIPAGETNGKFCFLRRLVPKKLSHSASWNWRQPSVVFSSSLGPGISS